MSIRPLSFTSVNPPPPRPASETRRPARDDDKVDLERQPRRDGGVGRLEQALLSALQTLGVGQPATAPATAAAAPVAEAAAAGTPTTTPDEPVNLASAVQEFASALMAALRDVGGGHGHSRGHGHAHGHHDDHGWRGRGYGTLSNRLETLAASLGTNAPVAPAVPTAPGAAAGTTVPEDPATLPVTPPADGQTAPGGAAAPVAATPSLALPSAAEPDALLSAFTRLQGLLQPSAAGASASDPAVALKQFLQTVAQGLKGAASDVDGWRSGSLLNLRA